MSKVIELRGHKKAKCELNQGLVMIVKLNVHSLTQNKLLWRTGGRTYKSHDNNKHPQKFSWGLKATSLA